MAAGTAGSSCSGSSVPDEVGAEAMSTGITRTTKLFVGSARVSLGGRRGLERRPTQRQLLAHGWHPDDRARCLVDGAARGRRAALPVTEPRSMPGRRARRHRTDVGRGGRADRRHLEVQGHDEREAGSSHRTPGPEEGRQPRGPRARDARLGLTHASQHALPGARARRRIADARRKGRAQLSDERAVEPDLVTTVPAARQVLEVRGRSRIEVAEAHEPEQLATDAPAAHRDTLRIAGWRTAVTGIRRSTGRRVRSAFSA